jgi:hypothetical protein
MGDRNFGDEIVAMGTGEEELLRVDESMVVGKSEQLHCGPRNRNYELFTHKQIAPHH